MGSGSGKGVGVVRGGVVRGGGVGVVRGGVHSLTGPSPSDHTHTPHPQHTVVSLHPVSTTIRLSWLPVPLTL